MENVSLESINRVLLSMRKEIEEIREHMVDMDSVLTEEDYKAFLDYCKEKREGKLVSHRDVRKGLGL